MDKLVIEGGHPLRGSLRVGGSKNTALMLMAAAVLPNGTTTIRNVPSLKDVRTFANVLRATGCRVNFDPDTGVMTLDTSELNRFEAPYDLVKQMRASFYMLGALLGRAGKARVSLPGGCAWGPRPVDLHLKGMEALGAEISEDVGYIVGKVPSDGLAGGTIRFNPSSVGATVNVLLAAVTANGKATIENAAAEPDVVVLCRMLQSMGARIDGVGTTTLTVTGVDTLQPADFTNCPDRIELGTYMIAAAIAGEPGTPITLTNANPEHLGTDFIEAYRATGTGFEVEGDTVVITPPDEITPVSIETAPYPGFPTDLQAQWTVFMTQAMGPSTVTDTVYTDRFKHIPELRRLGLNLHVDDNLVHVAGKNGQDPQGTFVMSTDLRASVALVLAGLVARGETHVLRVYHLDRGYERLEEKLSRAGIIIRRESYDEAHPEKEV